MTFHGKPVYMVCGNQNQIVWTVTQGKESQPELSCYTGALTLKFPCTEETDYVVPHPLEPTFYVVKGENLQMWRIKDQKLIEEKSQKLTIPNWNYPTWQLGYWYSNSLFLPQPGGFCILTPAEEGTYSVEFIRSGEPPVYQENELALQFKTILTYKESAYWVNESNLEVWSKGTIHNYAFPAKSGMHQVIPVLESSGDALWFTHGGNQGDLSSFGWSMGQPGLEGKGILTRLAQDPGKDRVVFTTISNSVSSNLFQSLFGKREFELTILKSAGTKWEIIHQEDYSLKKTDGLFGLFWPGDLNRDGFLDMLVADNNKVALHLSAVSGEFSKKGESLNFKAEKLLPLYEGGFALALEGSRGKNEIWEVRWYFPSP